MPNGRLAQGRHLGLMVAGAAALLVLLILASGVAPASAQGLPDPENFAEKSKDPSQALDTADEGALAMGRVVWIAEIGCRGRTHNPHNADWEDYHIAVKGDTMCWTNHPKREVSTYLYRSHWLGWKIVAHNRDVGRYEDAFSRASWNCSGYGTYNYHGRSYHYVTDRDGRVWKNKTDNPQAGDPEIRLSCRR